MRSRGDEGTSIFTADAMAEKFGVVKGVAKFESLNLRPERPTQIIIMIL